MFLQNTNTAGRVLNNASEVTNVAWTSIDSLVTSIIARLPFIAAGVLVAVLFFLAAKLTKVVFLAATKRTKLDERLRILFSRLIVVAMALMGVFTAFTVIIPSFGFGDLVAGIGLTSFVIGFATKDILNNLLSGVLILWQQPFKVGDQIFIDKLQGRVEYIGVRATSLRKDDGELVLVPNGDMYSGTLTIRGAGSKRRMNIELKVAYDADVEMAKKRIADALDRTEGVVSEPPPNVYVTDLAPEGIKITINFWLNTHEARPRDVFDRAACEIKNALIGAKIEPYPPSSMILRGTSPNEKSENAKSVSKGS
ncbi:MAG: mechanosensitive ion channel family protein [Acidobacteriota bacterium]